MAEKLIIIAVRGKTKDLERLEDRIEQAAIEATMDLNGIETLTTEILDGADVAKALAALQAPNAKP